MARMSRMDAAFLAMERPNLPGHLGTVMFFRPSDDGPLTYDAVLDTVAERLPLVPSARRVVAEVPFGLAARRGRPTAPSTSSTTYATPRCPRAAARPRWPASIGHTHAIQLDRARPLWELWVIEGLPRRPGRAVLQGPRRGDRRQHRRRADDRAARHRSGRAGRRSPTRSRSTPAARGPLDVVGRIVGPLPDQLRWAAGFPGRVAERAMRAAGEQWPGLRETAVEITQRTPAARRRGQAAADERCRRRLRRAPDRARARGCRGTRRSPVTAGSPSPACPIDDVLAVKHAAGTTFNDVVVAVCTGDAAALAAGAATSCRRRRSSPSCRCSWPGRAGGATMPTSPGSWSPLPTNVADPGRAPRPHARRAGGRPRSATPRCRRR